ncbi:glycerophosphodiester phosphodiesterase [Bradyrhizobium sp. 157]|nr:glycerophosphodiester phosphodiesterase [Bradyrhizobium sp. 157]
MKLIAHRGWSAGRGENSLAAFVRAARDGRISGVEFDVCRAADSDTLVVSHDPPRHVENALTLDAALSLLSPTDLELFVEVKETGLVSGVIERLVCQRRGPSLGRICLCRRRKILSVGGCATGAPGHHRHVPVEPESCGAQVCARCPPARLGRAHLDTSRFSRLVVRFLP